MKNTWKKILSVLLSIALVSVIFVSCTTPKDKETATDNEQSTDQNPPQANPDLQINIAVLSGSTGYGAVKMMNDVDAKNVEMNYHISMESSVKVIQDSLISGDIDIAALPTNKAAMIYNSTKSIQIIALNTLGVMYLVTTNGETLENIESLRGKTVCIPEEPSYILRALCLQAGLVDGEDVTIETYATPSDLVAAVVTGKVQYAVLPEPLLSTAMSKKDNIQISLNLTDEWAKVFDGAQLIQGCLVVRTEWAKLHPLELAKFLSDYKASIQYVNTEAEAASAMLETYFGTAAAVAQRAIPHCNLVYIDGEQMKTQLGNFYAQIIEMPGVNMGDQLPDDAFYYIEQK